MIDLICSTVPAAMDEAEVLAVKRRAFLAVCDEELAMKVCNKRLIRDLRKEIIAKLG